MTAMTTFFDPCSDRDETEARADVVSFLSWRDAEPALWRFGDFADLHRHLVGAASSRLPSAVLAAVARMVDADVGNDLATQLYRDAFASALQVLVGALSKYSGRSREECWAVASQELAAVSREICFHAELHAGTTVMSRTWARSFAAVSPRRCGRLRSEVLALIFRMRSATEALAEALAGRSVFDRLLTRLAPLDAVMGAVQRCELSDTTFEAACRERGILPLLARRQVIMHDTRLSAYENECQKLRAVVDGVKEDHGRRDDLDEDDLVGDDAGLVGDDPVCEE
jgi:hypothetical protein